jgi:hypothetical protein
MRGDGYSIGRVTTRRRGKRANDRYVNGCSGEGGRGQGNAHVSRAGGWAGMCQVGGLDHCVGSVVCRASVGTKFGKDEVEAVMHPLVNMGFREKWWQEK